MCPTSRISLFDPYTFKGKESLNPVVVLVWHPVTRSGSLHPVIDIYVDFLIYSDTFTLKSLGPKLFSGEPTSFRTCIQYTNKDFVL